MKGPFRKYFRVQKKSFESHLTRLRIGGNGKPSNRKETVEKQQDTWLVLDLEGGKMRKSFRGVKWYYRSLGTDGGLSTGFLN